MKYITFNIINCSNLGQGIGLDPLHEYDIKKIYNIVKLVVFEILSMLILMNFYDFALLRKTSSWANGRCL